MSYLIVCLVVIVSNQLLHLTNSSTIIYFKAPLHLKIEFADKRPTSIIFDLSNVALFKQLIMDSCNRS